MNATQIEPLCFSCVHYQKFDGFSYVCRAYPKGIPAGILYGDQDHRKPIAGDNGLQYEQKKGA